MKQFGNSYSVTSNLKVKSITQTRLYNNIQVNKSIRGNYHKLKTAQQLPHNNIHLQRQLSYLPAWEIHWPRPDTARLYINRVTTALPYIAFHIHQNIQEKYEYKLNNKIWMTSSFDTQITLNTSPECFLLHIIIPRKIEPETDKGCYLCFETQLTYICWIYVDLFITATIYIISYTTLLQCTYLQYNV